MRKRPWEIWLESEARREADFQEYLGSWKIRIETQTKELVQGHLQKADHNLRFTRAVLGLKEFNDWSVVGAYYSIYQASLALCALKGYSTKDHNATLLVLIKEFYRNGLGKEEIESVGDIGIEKEEVLHYAEAKAERKNASYSTRIFFDKSEVEMLRMKAISFVNKAKEIIESR